MAPAPPTARPALARAASLARAGLEGLGRLAEGGVAPPPRRDRVLRRPPGLRDALGVGPGTLKSVVGSAASIASLAVVAGVALGALWLIGRIGVWTFIAAAWICMGVVVYKVRDKVVLGRVSDALRRPEPAAAVEPDQPS